MNEKSLPIDREKHRIYSDPARRAVRRMLMHYAPKAQVGALCNRVQKRFCELLRDAPPFGQIPHSGQFYDAVLFFAYFDTTEDLPPREVIQQEVYSSFMASFDTIGKAVNANRVQHNLLIAGIFKLSVASKRKQFEQNSEWFEPTECTYDAGRGIVRYSFLRCPIADFARKHGFLAYLPYMCNCDHMGLQKIHAGLVRTSTCGVGDVCNYAIAGDRSSFYSEYVTVKDENGLLLSVRREDADDIPKRYGSLL